MTHSCPQIFHVLSNTCTLFVHLSFGVIPVEGKEGYALADWLNNLLSHVLNARLLPRRAKISARTCLCLKKDVHMFYFFKHFGTVSPPVGDKVTKLNCSGHRTQETQVGLTSQRFVRQHFWQDDDCPRWHRGTAMMVPAATRHGQFVD